MAERRMFSKSIIDSDNFLDLPATTQNLYFHLGMRADDDGFVNNPKKILRIVGSNEDDLKLLFVKNFVIPFDSGICVIKDWKIHNYIQKDRYKETLHIDEKQYLGLDAKNSYMLNSDPCIQNVSKSDTQVRLGKVSIGKDKKGQSSAQVRSVFSPPSLKEVQDYCIERSNKVDPAQFVDFYESKGWMVGKNKMKDWRAAVRTWEQNAKDSKMNTEEGVQYELLS